MKKELLDSVRSGELLRYAGVGVGSALVNVLLFALLSGRLHMSVTLGNVISISAATVVTYIGNKKLCFKTIRRSVRGFMAELWGFAASRLASMIAEIALVAVLVNLIGMRKVPGKVLVVVGLGVANYFLNKFVIFRPSRQYREAMAGKKERRSERSGRTVLAKPQETLLLEEQEVEVSCENPDADAIKAAAMEIQNQTSEIPEVFLRKSRKNYAQAARR